MSQVPITMIRKLMRIASVFFMSPVVVLSALVSMFIIAPHFAIAQYVPVKDTQLNSAFSTFSSNFSKYSGNFDTFSKNFDTYAKDFNNIMKNNTDSIRDIITAGDPGGAAKQECATKNTPNKAFAYTSSPDQPWKIAAATSAALSANAIPTTIDDIKINSSGSLRCILQDLVGWQKLSIFIQINTSTLIRFHLCHSKS